MHLALAEIEGNAFEGADRAEGFRDAGELEDGVQDGEITDIQVVESTTKVRIRQSPLAGAWPS
jgi:hypothetical protein